MADDFIPLNDPSLNANTYVPVPGVDQSDPSKGPIVKVPTGDQDSDIIPIDRVHQAFQDMEAKKPDGGTTAGAAANLDTDFENQMLASSQFTTPDLKSHQDSLVSKALLGDDGNMYYKGDDGKAYPTDSTKHVVLRDPSGGYNVYNRTDDTNEGPIKGRLLGFGRLFGQGFATGAPEVAASVPDIAGAAIRQGVELPKAVGTPGAAAFVSKVPLANKPLTDAATAAVGQIGDAAEAAAKTPTGEIVNPEQAGETARTAINAYAAPKTGVLADRVNQAYDNVKNSFTNPDVLHEPGNALKYASNLQQKYGKADLGWPKTLNDSILGPITKPGGIDYDSMKLVRQKVGEMLENPSLIPEGTSPNELKGLYGSLSEDLKDLVTKAGGNKALSSFTRANTYNRLVNERRATLQRVLGPESRSDEGLFGTIMRMAGSTNSADAKTLAVARKSIGEEGWKDVAAAAVNRLGKRVTDQGEVFTPSNFAKDYTKLSPAGKDALFGEAGYSDLRKALDDVGLLSTETGDKLEKLSHPAGIAHTGLGWFGAYEALNAMREAIVGGSLREVGAVAGVGGAAAIMAKVLSSPLTARNAARWLGAYKRYRNAPANAAALANLNNATQLLKQDQAKPVQAIGNAALATYGAMRGQ